MDKLTPLVYDELRALAHHYMRRERAGHTLQTTALVNEAYLRLVDQRNAGWQNRAHFFGVAARVMRHILIDQARARASGKRGGQMQLVSLDEAANVDSGSARELLALDEALNELAEVEPRRSRVVELRYFGGLSLEETAEVLRLTPTTVSRDWRWAKAWLYKRITSQR